MNLTTEQLNKHLDTGSLSAVYIISGDEPLLIQESSVAIRKQAKLNGYDERKVFHVDGKFDWETILLETDNISLFSKKKFVEIRLISGKPGEKGSRVIQEYLSKTSKETITLFIAPKLERSATKSKWFTSICNAGKCIKIWPIQSSQFPQWMSSKLNRFNIKVSNEALEILVHKVEGNLLAATQEIEKLKLLAPKAEISGEVMSSLVTDNAKFNVFILLDNIMEGNPKKACRILQRLKDEGIDVTIILWAIIRDLRVLIKATEATIKKESVDSYLQRVGVWDKRKPLFKKTMNRVSIGQLGQMLRLAGAIDQSIKGLRKGSPWNDLTTLVLTFCGVRPLSSKSFKLFLQNA